MSAVRAIAFGLVDMAEIDPDSSDYRLLVQEVKKEARLVRCKVEEVTITLVEGAARYTMHRYFNLLGPVQSSKRRQWPRRPILNHEKPLRVVCETLLHKLEARERRIAKRNPWR
jgi:hypothetical protein